MRRFHLTDAAGISQVDAVTVGPDVQRLYRAMKPLQDKAYTQLLRCLDREHVRFDRRSRYLFDTFRRLHIDIPIRFLAAECGRSGIFPHFARWLCESLLVIVVAGLESSVIDRIMMNYPRHGIPIGLRADGTLVLYIGQRLPVACMRSYASRGSDHRRPR